MPAVRIIASGDVLRILGDGHADSIRVLDDGRGTVTVAAGGEHFVASGIHDVRIATGGGADHVNYRLTGPLKTTEHVTAHLGAGADAALFDFSAGVAAGGHLRLSLGGGAGADRETIKIGSVAKGGSAVLDARGGKGRDVIAYHASGEVRGRLAATIRGGAGHDTEDIVSTAKAVGTGHVSVRAN